MAGIDIISDTTGKEIAETLQKVAAANMAAVRDSLNSVTWTELARYANNRLIPYLLDYGDMINDTWVDKSVSEPKEYNNPWHLAHMENVELENGEILENRPFFQTHYAQLKTVQFSRRAFLKCPDGLIAGTYTIKFAQAWSKLVELVWNFTLTKNVPAGGRVAGFFTAADTTTYKVYTYDADGKTVLETVTPKKGEAGTVLGTLAYNTRTDNLNSMQETFYGLNRWKISAMRQYLNSAAGKGEWWKPQDEWDVAPEQLATIPGYLSGCTDEFLAAIKKVKVTTFTNVVQDGDEADITYDRVFIPSLEQRYIKPQKKGEGAYFEYWKRRLGLKAPQGWYTAYRLDSSVVYALENHARPVNEQLRSAYRGYAHSTWCVDSAGGVSNYSAISAWRALPIVVI